MAKDVKLELERIYERDGALHPEKVVEAARDRKSPLHSHFDWNDKAAAHQHRLNQARDLIRITVKVIPQISNAPVRAFVSLSNLRRTGTGSYLATVDVLQDEGRYAVALDDAIKTLQGMQRRFSYLRELGPVWDAVAQLTVEAEAA